MLKVKQGTTTIEEALSNVPPTSSSDARPGDFMETRGSPSTSPSTRSGLESVETARDPDPFDSAQGHPEPVETDELVERAAGPMPSVTQAARRSLALQPANKDQ